MKSRYLRIGTIDGYPLFANLTEELTLEQYEKFLFEWELKPLAKKKSSKTRRNGK